MREYSVDLIIDKTFNVFAETVEEAKELAIQKARAIMGTYNSLEIYDIYETFNGQIDIDEDVEFENEYEVMCFNTDDKLIHTYGIEADHTLGAATAAEEFFKDDFPNEKLKTIRVLVGEQYDEYYFNAEEE